MRLSTKCRYGTRAMLELARNYEKGPVKRREIATKQEISPHYLESILTSLKSKNLIKTIRGANGGFTLGEKPEKISMFEIVTALEGSIAPVHCIESSRKCNRSGHCTAQNFWKRLHDVQVKTMKGTSLQSLLDSENETSMLDYSI